MVVPMGERLPFLSLILVRVGALLLAMPPFGARGVPVPVRIALGLALSWAILPLVPLPKTPPPSGLLAWGLAAAGEALMGLAMGWMVQLMLAAVPLTGQVLGFQMGLGMANVVDPLGEQQLSTVAQIMNLLAMGLFLALDGHHLAMAALFDSFRWVPAGGGDPSGWGGLGVEAGGHLLRSTLILAGPVLGILLVVQVALGILARVMPQMNVFIVTTPLQIGLGLLALGTTLGLLSPWLANGLQWLTGIYGVLRKILEG